LEPGDERFIAEFTADLKNRWNKRCIKKLRHKYARRFLGVLEKDAELDGIVRGTLVLEEETCRRRGCKYKITFRTFIYSGKVN